MRRKWKRRWQRMAKAILPTMTVGVFFLSAYSPVYANPTGGTVANGSAKIIANGSTTTVNQTSDKAGINWQSFSIGKGETVNFVQPNAASVALNRVVGNNASSIYGTLSANGKVYLINPNGVLFAPGAQVNVGGLVASTLNISDSDFQNGSYTFSGSGSGSVINRGNISAAGETVLIGSTVANEGVIAAKVTGMAAGNKVSLDFNGDSLLNVTVDTGAAGGSAVNSGQILSAGGFVVMSAGTKDALLNTVVNNSGIIRAQSVNNVNGVIRLEGNTATNSGTLDASGKASGQTGGTVKVLGDTVTFANGSSIDVSGDAGGGTALIGGAYQGGSSEYAAADTTVQSGTSIHADAITTGNGGQVVVWAKDKTNFAGTITAQGGSVSGDGGSVETSGHNKLKVAGSAVVNTAAANGKAGSWLLDPVSITIGDGGDIGTDTLHTALESGNVTITTGNDSATMSSASSTVNWLAGNGTDGDITVNGAISWDKNTTLSLSAYRDVVINNTITNTGGGSVVLRADKNGLGQKKPDGTDVLGVGHGIVTFGSSSDKITLSNSTGGSVGTVTIYTNPAAQVTAAMNGSSVYVSSYINMPDYTGYVSGGTLAAYMLVNNVYDLQYIGTDATTLSGVYALGRNIDAGVTAGWNSGAGFSPIGGTYTELFSGTIDGLGHTITGLTINRPGTELVGLIGCSDNSTICNVGLVGGSIVGGGFSVGSLVGVNKGGKITNCYSTGAVSGDAWVGGLVGWNLLGTITNSYSTGNVKGNASVGGLVGYNRSSGNSITNCYSTGTVSGGCDVGGLVGQSNGGIRSCYSTGVVYGTVENVGGLVGMNVDSITDCYSTGSVQGSNYGNYVGGLVGYNDSSGMITNCYSTGAAQGSNYGNYVGGLIGGGYGRITNCYSTGVVTGGFDGARVGGLVGEGLVFRITDCYWDTETSGMSTGVGSAATDTNYGTSGRNGKTTAEMMTKDTYSSWADFASHWGIVTDDGGRGISYPYLKWRYPVTPQVVSGTLRDAAGTLPAKTLQAAVSGVYQGSASTGANGYYCFLLDGGTLNQGKALLTYVDNTVANSSSYYGSQVYVTGDSSNLTNFNLTAVTGESTPVLTVSAPGSDIDLTGVLARALGSLTDTQDTLYSVSSTGAVSVTGNLSVSAGGNITESAGKALAVEGTATLSAADSNNEYDIILDNAGNALSKAISVTAGENVKIVNAPATKLGEITVSGDLNVTSGGAITQAGAQTSTGGDIQLTAAAITLDQALTAENNNITLTTTGGDIQENTSGSITADSLALNTAGTAAGTYGAVNLSQTNNNIGTLSGTIGALTFTNGGALTIGNLTAYGDVLLTAAGITINSTGSITSSGNATLVLSGSNAKFDNRNEEGGITVGTGKRYLIYLNDPANITFGGLANTYDFTQYGTSYSDVMNATKSIAQAAGNGIIYADSLTITLGTTGSLTKYYDGTNRATDLLSTSNFTADAATSAGTAVNLSETLNISGVGAKFASENAGSSQQTVSLEGMVLVPGVTDSNSKPVYGYVVTGKDLNGKTMTGYINPRPLTVTANNASRYVGYSNPAFSYTETGLTNGDSLDNVLSGFTLTTTATSASSAGNYAITLRGTVLSSNYTVNLVEGTLTVSKAPWQQDTYIGAVVHAEELTDWLLGGAQKFSPQAVPFLGLQGTGRLDGETNGVLPLTIIGLGINTDGLL